VPNELVTIKFNSLLDTFVLVQHVTKPTHRKGHVLDIIITTQLIKKLGHYTFIHNFDKCCRIFKILSLLYSPRNLQQNPCHIADHTLDVSLHYLAKLQM